MSALINGLKKFIAQICLLLALLVIVPIAVANRHEVYLALDPFSAQKPLLSFHAPMFVWLMASLIFGVILGVVVGYLDGAKTRKALSNAKKTSLKLQKEIDEMKVSQRQVVEGQKSVDLLKSNSMQALPHYDLGS